MRIVFATTVEYAEILVSQDWPAIKTRLEPLIVQYALEERRRILFSREQAIDAAYDKYKHDLLLTKRHKISIYTCPPPEGLTLYEPIQNLLNLPSGTGEFEKQVKSCVEDFIDTWPHLTVQGLASIYPSLHAPQNAVDVPSLMDLNILAVVSAFLCVPCTQANRPRSTFFGWADAMRHKYACHYSGDPPFVFSVEGHEAALALVGNLGLDPRNTLPHELGRPKRRFLCMSCKERWDAEKPGFGWRGMVLSMFFSFILKPCLHST